MRKLYVTMMLILLCGLLMGSRMQLTIDVVDPGKATAEYPRMIDPGQPMLNYYPLKVLLPFGEKYQDAELRFGESKTVLTHQSVKHAEVQVPISRPQDFVPVGPDPEIYENDAFFPTQDIEYLGTQYYRGYGIAIFNVYPFRYNPVSGEIHAHASFEIEISSVFDEEVARKQARFVTPSDSSTRQLERMVQNPRTRSTYDDYSSYKESQRNLDPADAKSMIIITDEARIPWFGNYATWRESHGISTGIYSMEYIYANYDGVDNAEKLRNFIIDAYSSWADTASPLEYVILGGDDEIVPERGVYGRVGNTVDNRMPSDLYYSNLDGDWNANGNDIYGEIADDTDMIPELHIGRFSAETQTEFNNIFHKTMYYVDQSTFSNNIAIFYGENLNNNPLTWGGDYKDDIYQYLPEEYSFYSQYQRDGTYSAVSVRESINSGVNVMNHMGHANETSLMGQGSGTIQQLQNTEYGFLYSQGCYPAAFDQRTSGDGECVGEHLMMASGGLFGFIGNTRYGWYMPGSIEGASQYYDREYFIGLFEEDVPELGKALTYSRLQNLNAALQSGVMRWCYMEMILFGDPSVTVKLTDPLLPLLTLESYEFDDALGDGDGVINPGESLRLFPTVRNAETGGTALNVSISIVNMPDGAQSLQDGITVAQILPGESNPAGEYLQIDLSGDLGYGKFYIRLAVDSLHPVTGLSTGVRYFDVSFDVTLFDSRFPWETANAGKSAPIVGDFDDDDAPEIIFGDVFGGVYIVGDDGEQQSYLEPMTSQNINRSSAMAQIDGLGGDDLIFTSRIGHIYAINTDGELIFDYAVPTPFLFSPVAADLDGDGLFEVVAGAMDGKLYAISNEGEALPGFPLQLAGSFTSELAVGILDETDGYMIIGGTNSGNLYVVNSQGGIVHEHNLGGSVTGAPVILDNGRFAVATNSELFLISSEGIHWSTEIPAPVAGGLITADLNQFGGLDIILVTVSGHVLAINQSGDFLSGFPVKIEDNFNCPPLIADIDADGHYEIVLHSYMNSIYAHNHDGSMVDGFPFWTSYNGATPGTLLDFDDDGYFKLVTGFSNGILMSNLRLPSSELTPWVTYRGSLTRQASAAGTGFVSNSDAVSCPVPDRLSQNYPNPFNPHTTIAFDLARAGQVRIEIFNTKGQKIRKLTSGDFSAGAHSVNWDGTDDGGQAVSSGLYFYRMQSASGLQTRKMLLLK